ncbi:MAG: glycosyltransferase [Sedimentisphaerales bacterium]|nr:glycosyltransferase [Sedimentisphaerales bacterium]
MPVYNGQETIRKAIDSLLAQTFSNVELTISDNASTDATEQICREYAARDARVRYIRQPANLGPARNFRFVLRETRAEYFMWAAHDDYWHPEFIQRCLSVLEREPGIAVACTGYWVLSRRYAPLKMRHFPRMSFLADEDPFTRVSNYMLLSEYSHKANVIYGLWRRPVVRETMDAFRDVADRFVVVGLDIAQIVHVLARFRAFQIPEPLFFKTYAGLPPGYITTMGHILKRRLFKYQRWKKRYEDTVRRHIEVVRIGLTRAGVEEQRYNQFLDRLQDRLIDRYDRPMDMLRELYRSMRAGLV